MKIRLHRYGDAKAFRSGEDFSAYASRQKAEFDAMEHTSPTAYQQWGKSCAQYWSHAAQLGSDASKDEATISQSLLDRPCLPFDGAIADLLRRLTQESRPRTIKAVLRALQVSQDGQSISNLAFAEIQGIADLSATVAAERSVTKPATAKRLSASIEDHETRLAALLEEDRQSLEDKRAAFEQLQSAIEERQREFDKDAAQWFQQCQTQWLDAHNSYVEQLKTQTAVELWQSRSADHSKSYLSFRKGAMVFGIGGGLAGLVWIFAGFALARAIFPDDKTAQLAAYSAGSIVLFTLFVWTLRVLIRSMISESHLSTDASARAAMAHTYLALSKEDQASQEDRAIILASLFAPIADGLVKDDGLPIFSPAALAASMITNPRSAL